MEEFFRGAIAMGYAVSGVYFLRFWKQTRDRLFGLFATAFLLLTVNRLLITLVGQASEVPTYLYLVRLAAFLMILWAVVDKNRRRN